MDRIDRAAGKRASRDDSGSANDNSGKGPSYRIQQAFQIPRDNDSRQDGKWTRRPPAFFTYTATAFFEVVTKHFFRYIFPFLP